MSSINRLALLLTIVLPAASQSQQPAIWKVSSKPTLQLGEAEGDSAYMFFKARNAMRLADGRILVLNAGSQQFRMYDARGKLVFAKGTRGRGPGEFNDPARLTRPAPDTLAIFDIGRRRLYSFTLSGVYIGERPMTEQHAYDGWYYRRSWIDGPADGKGRGMIRLAIDKMPPPDPAVGLRFIHVSPQGHLWVRGPVRADTPVDWWVHDLDGRRIARATTAPNFELHEIGRDYLLGVTRDEFDIEYVQLFAFQGSAPARRITGPDAPFAFTPKPVSDQVHRAMRPVLAEVQNKQEIFYSQPRNEYNYAGNVRELEQWRETRGFITHIARGGAIGWLGFLVQQQTGLVCAVEVGALYFFPPVQSDGKRPDLGVRIAFCE